MSMIRGDLSNRLIHLTKGASAQAAAEAFKSIVAEKRLIGGTGDIRGGYRCVCFSEAPLSVLTQVLAQPLEHGMHYAPLGVMVSKEWLFREGGRPVIYQGGNEYDLLPEAIRYRHVRYEPHKGIDHTWEREWRLHADEVALDPTAVTLVVPTRAWVEKSKDDHTSDQQGIAMVLEEDAFMGIAKFPWHFVVLEDLGVTVEWDGHP